MATSFRILGAADTRAALPMPEAIAAMREAFAALVRGEARIPLRTRLDLPEAAGVALIMPGVTTSPSSLGAKLLTLVPANAERGRPVIHGVVIMFDPESGEPAGLLDGTALTAIRTGAASGLATDLLARRDANRLAVIGSGPQARTQLEAVCAVREIRSIRVFSRTAAHARRFVDGIVAEGITGASVEVADSPAAAADGAEVICTATSSTEPLLDAADVAAGAHVNAVGSYTREMREVAPGLVRAARIVVDSREAALAEAGELMSAVEDGIADPGDWVELGDVVEGRAVGRGSDGEVTLFKSVGVAVQDLCSARRALDRAAREAIGIEAALGA